MIGDIKITPRQREHRREHSSRDKEREREKDRDRDRAGRKEKREHREPRDGPGDGEQRDGTRSDRSDWDMQEPPAMVEAWERRGAEAPWDGPPGIRPPFGRPGPGDWRGGRGMGPPSFFDGPPGPWGPGGHPSWAAGRGGTGGPWPGGPPFGGRGGRGGPPPGSRGWAEDEGVIAAAPGMASPPAAPMRHGFVPPLPPGPPPEAQPKQDARGTALAGADSDMKAVMGLFVRRNADERSATTVALQIAAAPLPLLLLCEPTARNVAAVIMGDAAAEALPPRPSPLPGLLDCQRWANAQIAPIICSVLETFGSLDKVDGDVPIPEERRKAAMRLLAVAGTSGHSTAGADGNAFPHKQRDPSIVIKGGAADDRGEDGDDEPPAKPADDEEAAAAEDKEGRSS